jgi:hypothetical protein
MFQGSIFLGQINYSVLAFIHVQFEPITLKAFLGDPYTCRQASAMISAGTIAGYQSSHQPVCKTALRLFIGSCHRKNDLSAN